MSESLSDVLIYEDELPVQELEVVTVGDLLEQMKLLEIEHARMNDRIRAKLNVTQK